ncbi:hypothetical protein [Mycobacteroides abscessus]|uniref:hypothetical protein n=1 Tax=Mycobacteroides abscessus TaxID=36809 RepID=UPI0018778CAA|nr:hypothetical protein [Mycobacteroides abscessus]
MRNSLAVLALVLGVGASTIGCSGVSTPVAEQTTSSTSSASARPLVDVEAVWQSEPLPDCPKPPVTYNGDVPQGLVLPDKASVADQLRGAQSPAPEGWVRKKLGWITQWLAQTRAGIIDHPDSPAVKSKVKTFEDYVEHVRSELQAEHDIPSDLDSIFPEGCS